HATLSLAEQIGLVCGQPEPVWQDNKLCIQPTQKGPPCNQTDAACTRADSYCQLPPPQGQTEGKACADAKFYLNPNRCVPADTQYQCADGIGPTTPCYDLYQCKCNFDGVII